MFDKVGGNAEKLESERKQKPRETKRAEFRQDYVTGTHKGRSLFPVLRDTVIASGPGYNIEYF